METNTIMKVIRMVMRIMMLMLITKMMMTTITNYGDDDDDDDAKHLCDKIIFIYGDGRRGQLNI